MKLDKYLTENKIETFDERYVGSKVILLLRNLDNGPNSSILSVILPREEMNKYNRNKQEDLQVLWKMAVKNAKKYI